MKRRDLMNMNLRWVPAPATVAEAGHDNRLNNETAGRARRKDRHRVGFAYRGHTRREEPETPHMVPAEEPVSVALELHHHRLDDMLDRIEIDVEAGNWGEARRGFSLFRRELEEHMRLEENLLLPALGMTLQVEGGAAALMRAEHPLIRELLEMIEIGLENECPIGEATDALEVTLADHNANEERLLYPMFERMATPEAYAAVAFELRPLLGTQNGGAQGEDPSDVPASRESLLRSRRPVTDRSVP